MKLIMSTKERDRLAAIRAVVAGQITQKQAAEQAGISARQMRRVVARYRKEGDAGLIHRSRGRPSNRHYSDEVQARAVELITEHYRGFGPTLAAEKLAERDGIIASKETVRQWMIEARTAHAQAPEARAPSVARAQAMFGRTPAG